MPLVWSPGIRNIIDIICALIFSLIIINFLWHFIIMRNMSLANHQSRIVTCVISDMTCLRLNKATATWHLCSGVISVSTWAPKEWLIGVARDVEQDGTFTASSGYSRWVIRVSTARTPIIAVSMTPQPPDFTWNKGEWGQPRSPVVLLSTVLAAPHHSGSLSIPPSHCTLYTTGIQKFFTPTVGEKLKLMSDQRRG